MEPKWILHGTGLTFHYIIQSDVALVWKFLKKMFKQFQRNAMRLQFVVHVPQALRGEGKHLQSLIRAQINHRKEPSCCTKYSTAYREIITLIKLYIYICHLYVKAQELSTNTYKGCVEFSKYSTCLL